MQDGQMRYKARRLIPPDSSFDTANNVHVVGFVFPLASAVCLDARVFQRDMRVI